MRQYGTFKIKQITRYLGERSSYLWDCYKGLSLKAKASLNRDALENYIDRLKPKVQSAQIMKCEILGNKSLGWVKVMVLLRGAWRDPNNTFHFSPKKDDIPDVVDSKKPSATDLERGWKSNLLIRTALIWLRAWCPFQFPSLWWAQMIFSWAIWEVLWRKILFLIWVVNCGNLEHARCTTRIETKFWDFF